VERACLLEFAVILAGGGVARCVLVVGSMTLHTKYAVVEHQSGRLVAVYATSTKAQAAVAMLDEAYRWCRDSSAYRVQPVNLQPEQLTAGKDLD
jgi:hypothetical protein